MKKSKFKISYMSYKYGDIYLYSHSDYCERIGLVHCTVSVDVTMKY